MRFLVTQDFGPHKKGDIIENPTTGMYAPYVVMIGFGGSNMDGTRYVPPETIKEAVDVPPADSFKALDKPAKSKRNR